MFLHVVTVQLDDIQNDVKLFIDDSLVLYKAFRNQDDAVYFKDFITTIITAKIALLC